MVIDHVGYFLFPRLTILRIILVPILLILIYNIGNSLLMSLISAIVFLLISFTDMLDGYIARSRNLVTTFGKFMDPIADKLLVNTLFIILGILLVIGAIVIIFVLNLNRNRNKL